MSRTLFAALFTLLTACHISPLPAFTPPAERATVLVPGYKGSFLAAEKGERIWITAGAALSSGEVSLALPFPGEHAKQPMATALHPDGPVTRVSFLGLGDSAYLPFLEYAARSLPGVVPFSYDWRLDIREAGRELCAQISALPVDRVDLIAHSMGGLVAMHCLRAGAPKVRRIVFAGTPFGGAATVFKNLARGDEVGRNGALLPAEALFTFASVWQLAPPKSPLLDRAPWLGGMGVFAEAEHRADPAYAAELDRQLEAAHQGWKAIADFAPQIPVLAIIGTGRATVSGTTWKAGEPPDFDHPPREDGDGLVPASSARPAFAHEEFVTDEEHEHLLNDGEVQKAIARFLQ